MAANLMPGELITIEDERWVVSAWHTESDGERSIILFLAGNHGISARWPYEELKEKLEQEGRINNDGA